LLASLALAYACLRWPQAWPALFDAELGLTPLKVALEWGVIVLHLSAAVVLWRRRVALHAECVMALAFAVSLSAMGALLSTLPSEANRP
jgi:hypothetical protein